MATAKDEPLEIREEDDGSITVNPNADDDTEGDDDDAGGDPALGAVGVNDDEDDRGTRATTDDDEDDGPAAGTDDTAAKRARRKQERIDRRLRAKEREEGLRRELGARDTLISQLNERMALIERKTTGSELANIDQAILQAEATAEHMKQTMAAAIKGNKGDEAAEASAQFTLAQARAADLKRLRQQHAQPRQAQAPDPAVLAQGNTWLARNKWYDPNGNDLDSKLAYAIEEAYSKEGGNPRLPEYWDELDRRIAKVLPHRAANGGSMAPRNSATRKPARTSPVGGSGRESGAQGTTGSRQGGASYTLSAARVQALKEAGMWDDPAVRTKMIRQYRDQDRAARNNENS